MAHTFDDETLRGVVGHMNADHPDDNLLIARAFEGAHAQAAVMTGFDGDGGDWAVTCGEGATTGLRVPWPDGSIRARREVRPALVAVYDLACARLGVPPRAHD